MSKVLPQICQEKMKMVESNFGVVDISFNFVVIIIANLDRSEKFNER